jgi:hypothetical protein
LLIQYQYTIQIKGFDSYGLDISVQVTSSEGLKLINFQEKTAPPCLTNCENMEFIMRFVSIYEKETCHPPAYVWRKSRFPFSRLAAFTIFPYEMLP